MATLSGKSVYYPYGATSPPYSPSRPHRGDDYSLNYENVVVAGTVIGISGETGLTDGPHCHVQAGRDEWAQQPINPEPYTNKPGTVVKTGTGSQWGMYVSIRVGDVNVFYCHLSKISVNLGQKIGDDMYNGQTAKQWHDQLAQRDKELENATRIAEERQAFVLGTLKRLGELLDRPTKGDIPEANFYVDEAVKGWKFRQNMINELQDMIKQLQSQDSVTQAEIDELAKKADELEQDIKKVNK